MEFHHHHGFLEEIFESNIAFGINTIDDQFNQNALLGVLATPPATLLESSPLSITSQTSSSNFEDFSNFFDPQTLNCSSFGQHFINPNFFDHHQLYHDEHHSTPNIKLESSPLFDQDYYSMFSMLDQVQNGHSMHDVTNWVNPKMPDPKDRFTSDPLESEIPTASKMGKNGKNCKVEGQPSKNLMAERRRRKRLNDRLSMLRSVVPKISKMDRTSILADTIDYMKELIEKINHMQQEMDISSNQFNSLTSKPKEIFIRNSPKFDVERRNTDTRVQVCCMGKPELLISTMTTLDALGLEIHQCVISCFNDFAMHASCSEEMVQRVNLNSEEIKQALFRNAGYGGKCL